jgi:hypothetical protein
MEYLLVMAFVFTILVAIIILAYSQAATFSSDVTAAQVQKVGNTLADAVNTVYYAGSPTKKTVRVYFPEHIDTITIDGEFIIFNVQGRGGPYEYAVRTATNLTGSLQAFGGVHTVTIEAQEGVVNITG